MLKQLLNFIFLSLIASLAWFLDLKYQKEYLSKIFYSFLAISVSYLVLKVFLEEVVASKIKHSKARYSFRKTTQILFILISFIIILRIWVHDPQALLVAYGLFAAGVAIALQDVFKNFAGTLAIFLTDVYRVGDRIEINSRYGDVMDIGLFYTSLLELREWVDGDQTTGRIAQIPNGQVLSNSVQNYNKDHNFLWEEISLPITYESNWKKAIEIIHSIVLQETSRATTQAEQEVSRLEERYYVSKRNIEPAIFIKPTDNWIMLRLRYVVEVRERRLVNNVIYKKVLEKIQEEETISIASETLIITSNNTK